MPQSSCLRRPEHGVDVHQYPLPLPEEQFAKLNEGQRFIKIDRKEVYMQIELHDANSKLLVINTPKRLFTYDRLPSTVASAPSLFSSLSGVYSKGAMDLLYSYTT